MPVPTLAESSELMRHRWDKQRYPTLVYVETTNFCNARCTYCLYDRMERPVEYMTIDSFKKVVAKVLERPGLKIGAMFCFGEPLSDATLFEKIRIARDAGVLTSYIGLNTNCSLLTPNKYDDILLTCSNITLSFVNTGEEFEQLTKLNWDTCYNNAITFINYRDKHNPNFQIEIGCNDVSGHNRAKVKAAFAGYGVDWARDAEIQWGNKVITGVIDRSIMYHHWQCDGYKGAMQIKPNGDCCFCAYDVIRNETKFANIFDNSWDEIEANFKNLWQEPSSLCLRCDFWWNYHQMVSGGWCKGEHIDDSWQEAYGTGIAQFWQEQHGDNNTRYLSNCHGKNIWKYLQVNPRRDQCILNIGVGTGRCTKDLLHIGAIPYALDISEIALARVKGIVADTYSHPNELPDGAFDLSIAHLVVQHMNDIDLIMLLKNVLRSLKSGCIFAIQYASNTVDKPYSETLNEQRRGLVRRDQQHMERLIKICGGEVVKHIPTRTFDPERATDDACWNGVHVKKAPTNA